MYFLRWALFSRRAARVRPRIYWVLLEAAVLKETDRRKASGVHFFGEQCWDQERQVTAHRLLVFFW